MKAIDETSILTFYVALQFKNSSDRKDYVLTGNAEGQDITSTVSSSFKFKNFLRAHSHYQLIWYSHPIDEHYSSLSTLRPVSKDWPTDQPTD